MLNKIKYFSALLILSVFSISAVADNVSRPGANNKMGLTKKTQEEKDNSFINKLIKGEYDGVSINRNEDLDQIKSEIADLKKQKEYSLNSNDKIIKQIKIQLSFKSLFNNIY